MYKFSILILILCLCSTVKSQKAVSKEIQNLESANVSFQKVDLFKFRTDDLRSQDLNLQGLKKGTIISLDAKTIQTLFQGANDFISIPVPVTERSQIILTLKRHEIFASDFKLFTSSDREHEIDYQPGLHYMGVVEGDPSSLVALSIYHGQIMALIATHEGNFVIGPIKDDPKNNHIYYNDRDLDEDFQFECGTDNSGMDYTQDQLRSIQNNRDVNDCLRIYIEINDDIVTAKGGAVAATDYITGLFNESLVLYANEQLTLTISEILAWTSTSPYVGGNSTQMLSSYRANTDFFNGDLSHLVSFDSIFGGVASIDGVCFSSPDYHKCFSGMRNGYFAVPIYSVPVMMVTHEMGHLLGSRHTQACVWNGNNTAIDGCVAPEGSCPRPPLPPEGGTIMSYCHVSNGSYYNFNLGFGPQPGNVIRNSVNAAGNCLSPCGQPTEYCGSNGANSSTEWIDKVVLGSINNLSGNNGGYHDYTSLNTALTAGNSYTITLTPHFTGGNHTKYWRIWIDYNQDFDFYDTGECITQGTGNNTMSFTFIVPQNSPTLSTRMRVSMKLAGYDNFCGTFPEGEVEDYTVNIIGSSPTCSDGIQNQGETGIDCGGPCPACPTCSDGIQNQNETGIDCGGVCTACPVSDSTILLGSYFETGWDSWIDGGPDVARVASSNSWEGQYSIQLADNSGAQSAMTSPVFNLSDAVGVQITFHFKAVSMEAGEDFWVQYKNGSGSWTTIGSYVAGTNFNNNTFYLTTVTVPNFIPTTAGSFRIQCDASDNNDEVYIDAVIITKLNGNELVESGIMIAKVDESSNPLDSQPKERILLYPNPATDIIQISGIEKIQSIRLMTVNGQVIHIGEESIANKQIHIESLPPALYILWVESKGKWHPARFIKI